MSLISEKLAAKIIHAIDQIVVSGGVKSKIMLCKRDYYGLYAHRTADWFTTKTLAEVPSKGTYILACETKNIDIVRVNDWADHGLTNMENCIARFDNAFGIDVLGDVYNYETCLPSYKQNHYADIHITTKDITSLMVDVDKRLKTAEWNF